MCLIYVVFGSIFTFINAAYIRGIWEHIYIYKCRRFAKKRYYYYFYHYYLILHTLVYSKQYIQIQALILDHNHPGNSGARSNNALRDTHANIYYTKLKLQ